MSPVVVPESLRETTLRLFHDRIQRDQKSLGVPITEELRAFLWDLSHPDQRPEPEAGFVNETSLLDSGSVLLTTEDIAHRMGCSVQYARRIAARIGKRRVGRQWLVDEQDFEALRRGK